MSDTLQQTTRKYLFSSIQKVTVGATSTASTGIGCEEVLLHATTNCYVNINSAATTSHFPLVVGEKFHMQITPDSVIHVIQDSAAGSLFIIPVY